MRVLGDAVNLAQQVRVGVARLLAQHGITAAPRYPDVSTRQKAGEIVQAFVGGQGIRLLP